MIRSYTSKAISYLAATFALTLAAPTLATGASPECTSDSDCDEGSFCEKSYYVNGCSSDSSDCDDAVHESEAGTCVVAPVQCEADSDCDEYMGCQSSDSGSCWASSDGSHGCTEPDDEAPKYCAPKTHECSMDSDCPREFECVEEQACPDLALCNGEEECEKPACEVVGGSCQPKRIECDEDAACPSDWSCVVYEEYACSGGGSSDGDPAEPGGSIMDGTDSVPDAPQSDDPGTADTDEEDPIHDPSPEQSTCEVIQRQGYCQPDAWSGGYFYAADDGTTNPGEVSGAVDSGTRDEDQAPTNDLGTESDDGIAAQNDGNGCSLSGRKPSHSGAWGWFLLLAFPLLRRRRSSTPSAT